METPSISGGWGWRGGGGGVTIFATAAERVKRFALFGGRVNPGRFAGRLNEQIAADFFTNGLNGGAVSVNVQRVRAALIADMQVEHARAGFGDFGGGFRDLLRRNRQRRVIAAGFVAPFGAAAISRGGAVTALRGRYAAREIAAETACSTDFANLSVNSPHARARR